MDLDTRIRDADPARALVVVAVDAREARRAHRRVLARGRSARRRLVVPATAALVLAAAAAAIVGLAARGETAKPVSAAAIVLARAGRAASANATVKLGRGEYFYNEIRTLAGAYYAVGDGASAQGTYVVQPETVQTWGSAEGSDHQVVTNDGPETLLTHGARGWVLGGSSALAPPASTLYTRSAPWGQWVEYDAPGVLLAVPDDLSRLPRSPAALTQLIDTNNTGLNEVVTDPTLPASPAYTFSTAAAILAAPAFGSSAALRVALCEVMASTPGIGLLGPATDAAGAHGIAIAGPLGGDGYSPFGGDRGVREEVIIDPSDGAVLQLAQVIADPKLESGDFRKVIGDSAGKVFDWTDYLASGIVNSPSATLPVQPASAPAD